MKRILFLLLLTVSVYGQNPSRFAKIQITGNTNSGTATKVNVQEANGDVNTQTINTGFNKNIGLGGSDVVGANTLLNQYATTPSDWTAQSYVLNSVVFYGGKQWIAKIATVAGDVPSVSSKWEEITFEALANKTVTVDQTIIDGSTNAVSGNAVFDGLALKSNIGHTHVASQITDLSKASVGLGNVDNTSDLSKPLSTATINALATKAPISSVHNPVTIGTANGLSLSTQRLSLGLASSGVTGALSGTDWNTFNGKQNALTNPVIGTGTSGQVAFWNGTNTQTGDNGLFWDNTNKRLGIDTNIPSAKFTLGSVAQEEVSYGFITPTTNWGKASSYLSFKSQEPVGGDTNFSIKLWKGTFSPDYGQALTRFFIDGSNGNVGIGTTTPNAKFNVAGNIISTMIDATPTIGATNYGSVGFPLLQLQNVKNGVEKSWNIENGRIVHGDLGFYNAGGERVIIKDNGRVLINKTNDDLTNQLQVAGTISASPATTANQVVVKSQLDAAARPYKVYTALLNQTGTNAPTATVLENTLGGTVVWSRNITGEYYGTLTGAFTSGKTYATIVNSSSVDGIPLYYQAVRISSDVVRIISIKGTGQTDSLINGMYCEIRVYN